jgi:hypothetical protein
MDSHIRDRYRKMGCKWQLGQWPVMSYSLPFITLAFHGRPPRATVFNDLHNLGYAPYGPLVTSCYGLNVDDNYFYELTFKEIEGHADIVRMSRFE